MTGSKYLVTHNGSSILVDCGLFQGVKTLREKNWQGLDLDASRLEGIILTHAHLDHSGYIPRLIKEGFKGKVYCTDATKDLCKVLLPDAGHLMEEEAEYLNRRKKTKHSPALPLFSEKDGLRSVESFEVVKNGDLATIGKYFEFEFLPIGHILGASAIILHAGHTRIAFSGDVGRLEDPMHFPPTTLHSADYLVVESTYGNRLHEDIDPKIELQNIVNSTCKDGGVVMIPAFAVGRAQTILHYLTQLKLEKKILNVPIYLNSPMATAINGLMIKHMSHHKLTYQQCQDIQENVNFVKTVEESIALNESKEPMVIVAGSGMMEGGRILHHLKAFGPSAKNALVLTGYQAAGTRGEALQNGAAEIKIHGSYVPIKAKVKNLTTLSAHADYSELITWLKDSRLKPKKVFVTHGEASASDEFRRRLSETFNWDCVVPNLNSTYQLE